MAGAFNKIKFLFLKFISVTFPLYPRIKSKSRLMEAISSIIKLSFANRANLFASLIFRVKRSDIKYGIKHTDVVDFLSNENCASVSLYNNSLKNNTVTRFFADMQVHSLILKTIMTH